MSMKILLFLVPFFAVISSLILYKHNGKRDFLKFDVVQFIYAFVVAPILFVWLKTFIFLILQFDSDIVLSFNQIYVIETSFSVFFLYIYAFTVIHALTASFQRKVLRDPLWDIFEHSEYFHLWLSHLVMIIGSGILLLGASVVNLLIPFDVVMNKFTFYLVLFFGVILGIIAFFGAWLSDPKQEAHFMRIVKLSFAFFFLVEMIVYFVFDPTFSAHYIFYWATVVLFSSTVFCSLFFHKSERVRRWYDRFKFLGWGNNIQLFGKK